MDEQEYRNTLQDNSKEKLLPIVKQVSKLVSQAYENGVTFGIDTTEKISQNAVLKAYHNGYNEATNKALEFMASHAYDYKFMGDQCIEDFTKFMKGDKGE